MSLAGLTHPPRRSESPTVTVIHGSARRAPGCARFATVWSHGLDSGVVNSRVDRSGPLRTCIGCRQRVAKDELLRLVAGTDAQGREAVVPDPTGTAPGRGAHLHPTLRCFELAERRRAFARALRYRGSDALVLDPVRDLLISQPGAMPDTEHPR